MMFVVHINWDVSLIFIFSKICTPAPLLLVIFPCLGRFYCSVHQQRSVILICITNMTEDFSPKALVVVERLLELLE